MFCICCLEGNGPYIKLVKCVHGDYLEMFTIPDLKPPIEQVICHQCHAILRKIKQFKIQVEESFSLLLNQSYSMEMKNRKKKNIRVSKVVHLNIPDTAEIDAEAENITKNRNVETALEIINNNSTSLQTLAACNLTSITETLLKATTENLNLELNRVVLPKTSKLEKEVVDASAVLPVNIKYEIENEVIDIIDNTIVLPGHENNLETEVATGYNEQDDGNPAVLPIKTEKGDSKIDMYVDELLKGAVTTAYDKIKDYNRTVLPEEMRKESEEYVVIDGVYGTAVLPTVKTVPEDGSNSFTKRVMELNDSSSDSSFKSDDDNAGPGQRPGAPPLIPIRLRVEELAQERLSKLTSKEYLQSPYRCDYCIIAFNYKANLSDHNKRKHEMKMGCVSCVICKQVVLRDEIKDHEFNHSNRIECEKCKKRFVLFDEAYEHYKEVHATGKTKRNIKRQDLKSYRRNKKRKHEKDTEKADSGIRAMVTSSMTGSGHLLDHSYALTAWPRERAARRAARHSGGSRRHPCTPRQRGVLVNAVSTLFGE